MPEQNWIGAATIRNQKDREQLGTRRTHLLQELSKQREAELRAQELTYGKVKLEVFFDRSLSRDQKSEIAKDLAVTRLTSSPS